MDAKQAVQQAREYLEDLFDGEDIFEIGLEEVEFDDTQNEWKITLGFSRSWDRRTRVSVALGDRVPRSYKVIRIDDIDGEVISLMDRGLPASST